MNTKLIFAATAALLIAFGGVASAGDVVCKPCKMCGIKNVELARHQRALAKTTGKQICPNCAGLASAARFGKDGTIFQADADFVCSGCQKKY